MSCGLFGQAGQTAGCVQSHILDLSSSRPASTLRQDGERADRLACGSILMDFENRFDLDRHIARQDRGAYGTANADASFDAEQLGK